MQQERQEIRETMTTLGRGCSEHAETKKYYGRGQNLSLKQKLRLKSMRTIKYKRIG
jgi:hypothetical protein